MNSQRFLFTKQRNAKAPSDGDRLGLSTGRQKEASIQLVSVTREQPQNPQRLRRESRSRSGHEDSRSLECHHSFKKTKAPAMFVRHIEAMRQLQSMGRTSQPPH
ncbi:hypothetical protein Nepgr_022855 [Nepenthes gracilis]|uniref:Uncharacterized protein n=1 Tax=Nepenthes gracilis TaxID=150966 RepID=A0AAD3XXD7_NEPGR|nr:hypothetical protein Nepgr_022855 [Nepenthes gracilis]